MKITTMAENGSNSLACFRCRDSKQKCDRQRPCKRCTSSGIDCQYPTTSHRGRKRGSTNKPETTERLLKRVNRSAVRDRVISALLAHSSTDSQTPGSRPMQPRILNDEVSTLSSNENANLLYSPLQILADAVSAIKNGHQASNITSEGCELSIRARNMSTAHSTDSASGNSSAAHPRFLHYFTPRVLDFTDWEVFASQCSDTASLQLAARDPIAAGLIEQKDVDTYFDLFFRIRNPLVGLMDPLLHTPSFVHARSFTLFTVICALGCAVATSSRDKLLYPALISLAEDDVKWSIGSSVKSLETIQAIINMVYWAPTGEKQSDEPSWLRLGHAAQLARDIGINRPSVIAEKLANTPTATVKIKQSLLRNFERTWIYVFIADKSFGIATGRPMCISRKELPSNVAEWWRLDGTAPLDRLLCGIVEMRIIVLKAFEERKTASATRESILQWQNRTFEALSNLCDARCAPDHSPSSANLSILAFYLEYSLLLLNAHASRDLNRLGVDDSVELSDGLAHISRQNIDIATRLMDLTLFDPLLLQLARGFQNTQFVMLCHVAAEIIQVIKRGLLSYDAMRISSKARMLATHLDNVACTLPPSLWASLYSNLYQVFVRQLDVLLHTDNQNQSQGSAVGALVEDTTTLSADWLYSTDAAEEPLDLASWFESSFLQADSPLGQVFM